MSVLADDSRERPGLPRRLFLGIFFLALFARLVALLELADSPWTRVLLGDARHFDEWGRLIAAGGGSEEAFFQAPLYAYLLGGLYALCGHAPDLVRVLQCTLGSFAAAWIATATCRLAGPRAALWAGGLAALCPAVIRYDLELQKTSLAFSLCALLLLVLVHAGGARLPVRALLLRTLLAGLLLGTLTLLRENMAVLLLPVAWAMGGKTLGRGRTLALLAAGAALALVPSTVHNLRTDGGLLPTASNAGVNFYIGNGAEADGMYRPLVAGRGHPDHEREDARRIGSELSSHTLSAAEVSGFWFRRARGEIAEDPRHFLGLLARKARLLAHQREIMDATALEVFQDDSIVLRILGLLSFGLLFPLAVAGALLSRGRPGTGPLLAAILLLAASIVAFFVVGRFRVAALPLLLPFAGIALAEYRAALTRPVLILCVVLSALLAWWPLELPGDPRATSASNLSSELLRLERPEEAEHWARVAHERSPESAEAAFNLGLALRRLGQPSAAAAPFRAAMRLEPAYTSDCLAELGAIRALEGDAEGARTLLLQALEQTPEHPQAKRYLDQLVR